MDGDVATETFFQAPPPPPAPQLVDGDFDAEVDVNEKNGSNTNMEEPDNSNKPSSNPEEADNPGDKPSSEIDEADNPDKPKPATSFAQAEAALDAYLEEKNPKPKKLSIREMIMRMPGYDKIAQAKPKLSVGLGDNPNSQCFIDFSDKKEKKRDPKVEKGITELMERFVKHASAGSHPNDVDEKPKHIKLHVNKLMEDSQGGLVNVQDEIDYMTTPQTEEEEDIMDQVQRGQGASPREQVPGEKLYRLRNVLKERIRLNKAKHYEEKMKLYAMYNGEKELEEKGEIGEDELPEDEVDEEEEDVEDETDSEEEEDEEDYVVPEKKKKRKRLLFVEDEAEDEDEERASASSDDDGEEDLEDVEDSQSQQEQPQQLPESGEENSNEPSLITKKPKLLIHNPDELNLGSQVFVESQPPPPPPLDPIAQLIAAAADNLSSQADRLVDLCSGQFPSQAPCTPAESQECFGFDVDEDDEKESAQILADDEEEAFSSQSSTQHQVEALATPSASTTNSQSNFGTPQQQNAPLAQEDTPKMMDHKVVKRSSLGRRFEEAKRMELEEKQDKLADKSFLDSDDEYDIISSSKRPKAKKRKRIQYSDDEDEEDKAENGDVESELDEDEGENHTDDEEVEEDDEEAEYERRLVLESQAPPPEIKKPSGLFGRDGRLRKKFVEEEAELSGSEEGSGDEDEKGLNFYEQEEGDNEDLDDEEVRKNLEKAHLKHLLDKDDREIRLLQEEYLERGDLEDGKQRERKFRWSNVDDECWAENAMMGDSDGDGENEEETAEELERKRAEIEKRKWLHENSQMLEATEEESQKLLFDSSKFLKLGTATKKKIESFIEHSSTFVINESSNSQLADFSISTLVKSKIKMSSTAIISAGKNMDEEDGIKLCKANSQPLFASPDEAVNKFKRGSFLSRGSPSLCRLAEITKVHDVKNDAKTNSRNFVFSVVTPPDQASKQNKGPKRPANSQGAQPKKMVKIDRSFSNLDDSSKDASIFKWI